MHDDRDSIRQRQQLFQVLHFLNTPLRRPLAARLRHCSLPRWAGLSSASKGIIWNGGVIQSSGVSTYPRLPPRNSRLSPLSVFWAVARLTVFIVLNASLGKTDGHNSGLQICTAEPPCVCLMMTGFILFYVCVRVCVRVRVRVLVCVCVCVCV